MLIKPDETEILFVDAIDHKHFHIQDLSVLFKDSIIRTSATRMTVKFPFAKTRNVLFT